MKQDNGRTARSRATPKSQSSASKSSVSAAKPGADTAMAEGAIQFAAERAYDLADALHERARLGIEWAQHSLTHVSVDRVLRGAQPLLARGGTFVRRHPLRAGLIVLLAVGAAVLVRSADTEAR